MVEAETSGEARGGLEVFSKLQSGMTQQCPYAILNSFGDVQESLAGLDAFLYPSSSLAVHLSGLAVVLDKHYSVLRQPPSVSWYSLTTPPPRDRRRMGTGRSRRLLVATIALQVEAPSFSSSSSSSFSRASSVISCIHNFD